MLTEHENEGANNNDDLHSLYGDLVYPLLAHIFGGFRNPSPGSPQFFVDRSDIMWSQIR